MKLDQPNENERDRPETFSNWAREMNINGLTIGEANEPVTPTVRERVGVYLDSRYQGDVTSKRARFSRLDFKDKVTALLQKNEEIGYYKGVDIL